ncbi:MAG TPA: hypothetical protein VMB80_11095 [Candidatus Acidoferrum sp.]|nr:hypothetical protein [Candidatus Acidoferrum sp.]
MKTLIKATSVVALAIAGLGITLTAHGALVIYTVDGVGPQQFAAPTTPPADAPWGPAGYPGDTVELQSYSGSFDLVAGTTVQKINTLLWTINYTYGGTATDPNAWSDVSFAFNATRNMTIDGVGPVSLTQAGSLLCSWDNDHLSLAGGPTVTFYVQGYRVDVTALGIGPVDGSNFDGSNPWVQPGQDVMAQFDITEVPVPEPSTMIAGALLLLPLGASVLRILRKNRQP